MKKEEVLLDIQKLKNAYNLKTVKSLIDSIVDAIKKRKYLEVKYIGDIEIDTAILEYYFDVYQVFPNYRLVNEFLDGNKNLAQNETVRHCLEIARVFYEKNKISIDNYEIIDELATYRLFVFNEWDAREKKEKEFWYKYYENELKHYKKEEANLLKNLKSFNIESEIANKILKWDKLKLKELKNAYQRIHIFTTPFDKNLRGGVSGLACNGLISNLWHLTKGTRRYYSVLLILMFYGQEFFNLHIDVETTLKNPSCKRDTPHLYPYIDALRKRAEKFEKSQSTE